MKKASLIVFYLALCSCTMTTSSGGERKFEGPWDVMRDQLSSLSGTSSDLLEAAKSGSGPKPEDSYPKASEDASIIYELESNIERTQFFIDAKEMGIARRLKVKINNQEHTVVAKPEGCIKKEEFIRPPYVSQAPLRFIFLLGECRK